MNREEELELILESLFYRLKEVIQEKQDGGAYIATGTLESSNQTLRIRIEWETK